MRRAPPQSMASELGAAIEQTVRRVVVDEIARVLVDRDAQIAALHAELAAVRSAVKLSDGVKALSIAAFSRRIGQHPSTTCRQLKAGKLRCVRVAGRRLIALESIEVEGKAPAKPATGRRGNIGEKCNENKRPGSELQS
jgi:hypothetical protein